MNSQNTPTFVIADLIRNTYPTEAMDAVSKHGMTNRLLLRRPACHCGLDPQSMPPAAMDTELWHGMTNRAMEAGT